MGSTRRRSPLPPDWPTRRRRILHRDPTCTLTLPGHCTGLSTEVHHTIAHNYHQDDGLAGVCHQCHATVTGRDANATRRALNAQRRRATQPHPAFIVDDQNPSDPGG